MGSFKAWAEDHFGSVELAFKAMDVDGSGFLTFSELRRACQKLNWQGEIRLVFVCLDVELGAGKMRRLSYKEIAFLDSWLPNTIPEEDDLQHMVRVGIGKTMRRCASTPVARARSAPICSSKTSACKSGFEEDEQTTVCCHPESPTNAPTSTRPTTTCSNRTVYSLPGARSPGVSESDR